MSKRLLILCIAACAATVFMAAGLYAAANNCPDTVTMKNENAFKQHRMGIVDFTHKKHAEEYGAGCGDCHHDENGKPLTDLSCEDEVQSCYECHSKQGRPSVDRSLPPEERAKAELDWYYGAIHKNCKDCHMKYNQENQTQAAPVSCTQCHPRPKQ